MAINFLPSAFKTSGLSGNSNNSGSSVNYKQYNPQEALQRYMQDNNCDMQTAKAALEQMYGAPTQSPQEMNGNSGSEAISGNKLNGSTDGIVSSKQGNDPKADFDKQLRLLGIPDDIVQTHDQDKIKAYADENNITLPDPPQKGQRFDSEF